MGNAIIVYSLFMLVVITIAVVFAMRSGQFKKADNANSLPLEIEEES